MEFQPSAVPIVTLARPLAENRITTQKYNQVRLKGSEKSMACMNIDELLAGYAPLLPVEDCPALVAHQAKDVFALWEAWETDTGEPQDVPFWATVWPAARVTAAFLMNNPGLVEKKRVLEIGCGGAVASIAAAKSGATLCIANDIAPAAQLVARKNANANSVSIYTDTRDFISNGTAQDFDLVLVADMFYQKEFSERLLGVLTAYHQRGVEVIIADGRRPFAPTRGVEILTERTLSVSCDLEGVQRRTVRLMRMD